MQLYTQDPGSSIIYLRAEACEDSYFTRISVKINLQKGVFTHLEGTYANLLNQKKTFAYNSSWLTVSLFWSTNMTTFTPCENALLQLRDLR